MRRWRRSTRSAGHVVLSTGDALPYDKLALCTGARPRRLPHPGSGPGGVFTATAADAEMIREAAAPGVGR